MYLNFIEMRIDKSSVIEIVASDSVSVSEKPMEGYKSVDISGHENDILYRVKDTDGVYREYIRYDDYFVDGITGEIHHVFNRSKYDKGEWCFDPIKIDDFSKLRDNCNRRKAIREKIKSNISIGSELKIHREVLLLILQKLGMTTPESLQWLTNTIESIKKNNPKETNSAISDTVQK